MPVARGPGPFLLAVVSGGLYALSFPPPSLSALAWVALVPLLLALGASRPATGFRLGVVWFLVASAGFAAAGPTLVARYFEAPWYVGWAAFASLTLVFGPLYGLWGAWVSWLMRRGTANPLVIAAGWGVVEYARTAGGSIFGWALLAYSQPPGARVLQSADLGGPYLPGMVLVAVSAAAASLVRLDLPRSRRPLWIGLTTLVAAMAYGQYRLARPIAAGPDMRVALVQGATPPAERWKPEHHARNLVPYAELAEEARGARPDLIVWPEYAIGFYLRDPSGHRERLLEIARRSGTDLLVGGPHYRGLVGPQRYYNSAFLLRGGRVAGRYDKVELLPLAERAVLGLFRPGERVPYTPGRDRGPLRGAASDLGVLLCSETLRPDPARRATREGATLLVNPSNDTWLGSEAAAQMQVRAAALRAIENRRFLLRATDGGYSAIIDARGRVVARSEFGRRQIVAGIARPVRMLTPYVRQGDVAAWLAAAVVLWGSARTMNRRRW